jgi:hypothetical protein
MTSDSEKVLPTKETKQKYQREDLIWEAVRRNELYKKDYYQLLSKKYGDREIPKWEKLYYFCEYFHWEMLWLFNHKIDIDEIKVAIASGELKEKDHPYHHIYKVNRYPVIQFEVPGSMFKPQKQIPRHCFTEHDGDHSIVFIKKDVLKDRLIISIDPMADNTQIVSDIIEIKKIASEKLIVKLKSNSKLKDNREIDEEHGDEDDEQDDGEEVGEELDGEDDGKVFEEDAIRTKFYNPSDIVSIIRWLKMYDTVIMNFIKNNPKEHLKTEKGALILPKERGLFQTLVPDSDKNAVNTLNHVKMWKDRYQDAIKLIQVAPNIIFNRSRS